VRKCKVCGKPETDFDSVSKFLLHCRLCKKEAGKDSHISETINDEEFIEVPDVAEEPETEEESDNSISIPLSICPKELGYLADDKLIKIMVIGRKRGNRFVVEETKYR